MIEGIQLRVPGANYEAYATSIKSPVPDGLLYWGFLNDSVEKLGKNFAPQGSVATVSGTPPVTNKNAVLDDLNNIQTGVVQTPSMTIIAVGNPDADGLEKGMFVSSYRSARASGLTGLSGGVSLYVPNSDAAVGTYLPSFNVSYSIGVNGAATLESRANLPATDITKPAFLVGSYDSEKISRLHNMTTGQSAAAQQVTGVLDVGVAPFKIGAAPDGTFTSLPKNMYFAAIYNRKLTEAEKTLIYTYVKSYLAKRNVII